MGRFIIFGICAAFFSFSTLVYSAGLVEVGLNYPLNAQSYSAGGSSPNIRFTDSRTFPFTSSQPTGNVRTSMTVTRGFSNFGTNVLFRRALVASPVVFAATGAGSILLAKNGYEFRDGSFYKIDTDPANPAFWGSAPIGVTYSGAGVYNSDDLFSVATAVVNNGIGCKNGECVLTGIVNQSPNCLETLRPNCALKPTATKNGYPHSGGYFGQISISNSTGDINCAASGDIYDPTHFGCYSVSSAAEEIPVEEVAEDITEEDIEELDDEEIVEAVEKVAPPRRLDQAANDGTYGAANDDFYPEEDEVKVVVNPTSVDVDISVETEVDANTGVETKKETKAKIDFSPVVVPVSQPRPNPLANPAAKYNPDSIAVESTETVTTTVTENGALVSTSTSTNAGTRPSVKPVNPAYNQTNPSIVGNPSSPSSPSSGVSELPAFCSWVPDFVCGFYSWAQEPFSEPEPDLSGILIDEDFEREKSFSFGSKTCPADILIPVPFLSKQIAISYAPFCDLASLAYYMVMMSAYVFAAYISIGVSRG